MDKDKNLLTNLSADDARGLITDGTAQGGMIPKLTTAIEAVEAGVDAVVILDVLTSALFVLPATAAAQDAELRGSPAVATEAWEICNETSYMLRVATAYIRDGKISPKGWEQVRPGGCDVQRVPAASPRYVFAESAPVHQGGIREWAGTVPLCVSTDDFTADATKSCQLQNLETRNYLSVDPTDPRTTFIEPDNFAWTPHKPYDFSLQERKRAQQRHHRWRVD